MSVASELAEIFSDLPEEERLAAVLDALQEGIKSGILKAVRDEDGGTRYVHTEHYGGEPQISIDEVVAHHQEILYGKGMN